MVKAELTDLQDFLGLVVILQDFPVLENAKVKFQDFPGFRGPILTVSVYDTCECGTACIFTGTLTHFSNIHGLHSESVSATPVKPL